LGGYGNDRRRFGRVTAMDETEAEREEKRRRAAAGAFQKQMERTTRRP
jgi:hypothetical protein